MTNDLKEYLQVRVGSAEKEAFSEAARIAGIPLSAWVRERLRRIAVRELQEAAVPIAFLMEQKKASNGR